jgi:hypothetical protein
MTAQARAVGEPRAPWAGAEFKCPVCGAWVPLEASKGGKPHGFCSECGLQLFFRRKPCIEALQLALEGGKSSWARRRPS